MPSILPLLRSGLHRGSSWQSLWRRPFFFFVSSSTVRTKLTDFDTCLAPGLDKRPWDEVLLGFETWSTTFRCARVSNRTINSPRSCQIDVYYTYKGREAFVYSTQRLRGLYLVFSVKSLMRLSRLKQFTPPALPNLDTLVTHTLFLQMAEKCIAAATHCHLVQIVLCTLQAYCTVLAGLQIGLHTRQS